MTAAPALGVRCIVAASKSPNKLAMLRGERAANMTAKPCEQLLGEAEQTIPGAPRIGSWRKAMMPSDVSGLKHYDPSTIEVLAER
jgi:hypothetical protein